MRPWTWVRRVLALVVTVVFVLGIAITPVFAAAKSSGSRSFSSPKPSSSSGSRSFSSPKPSTPSAPSRSFSTPKSTTPSTPPKSYSSPAPSTTPSTPKSYSSPSSPSYSGSDRSYSSPDRSFSSQRPSTSTPSTNKSLFGSTPKPTTPPVEYDVGRSRYPTRPPVIVYAPTPGFDPWYWQDYYYGRPWYWRVWHRPVYYGTSGGWGINWWPIVIGGGIGIWILLAVLSARTTRRR